VTVCAAFSGRLDHTLAAVGALARAADLLPRISEPGQEGWLLDSRHRAELAIGPSGATFSLVALDAGATVTVSGARWPLHYVNLDALGSLGISNRVEGDASQVRVHEGAVLVMVCDPVLSSPSSHDDT
jgi:thiamine pyrophosphokinase